MCDINRTSKQNLYIGIYEKYTEDSASTSLETWSGVNKNNIALFNGLAQGNTDALVAEASSMDLCMTHAAPTTNAIHAHSISPCACEGCGSTSTKPGTCLNNASPNCTAHATWTSGWTANNGDYGGTYGIAKDGHVIYGPYNSNNELWSCDDVDMCNGFFVDSATGEYGYASTTFFPYLVGCWGPAPMIHPFRPTCTSSTTGCPASSHLGLSFSAIALFALLIHNLF